MAGRKFVVKKEQFHSRKETIRRSLPNPRVIIKLRSPETHRSPLVWKARNFVALFVRLKPDDVIGTVETYKH